MNKKSYIHSLLFVWMIIGAMVILGFSLIRESRAQIRQSIGTTPVPMMSQTTFAEVPLHGTYQLPYPGMLPVHPLYSLKMIRDRIQLLFTFDPTQKTQLLLFLANKRIATAEALLERGYIGLAMSTAMKAETYLGQAIALGHVSSWNQIKLSTLKHEEVLEKISIMTDGSMRDRTNKLEEQLSRFREQIVSKSNEPFGYQRPEDLCSPETTSSTEPDDDDVGKMLKPSM